MNTTMIKASAAVGVAAAGALIVTKPERAWQVILVAVVAVLLGYIVGWILDELRNNDDHDGFA